MSALAEAMAISRRATIVERYRLKTGETLAENFVAAIDEAALAFSGSTGWPWLAVVDHLIRLVAEWRPEP